VPQLASRLIRSPVGNTRCQLRVRSLGIHDLAVCRVGWDGVNHAPPHPFTQLPQPLAILVNHDNRTRLGVLSSI
jgi:hypothetical protein